MAKRTKDPDKIPRPLAERMLAVEDPVEMITEEGSEILVGTEEHDEETGHWHRDHQRRRSLDNRRTPNIGIRGVGRVATED